MMASGSSEGYPIAASSCGRKSKRTLQSLLYKDTNLDHGDLCSWPTHSPKSSPPQTITLKARSSPYKLEGNSDIQTMTINPLPSETVGAHKLSLMLSLNLEIICYIHQWKANAENEKGELKRIQTGLPAPPMTRKMDFISHQRERASVSRGNNPSVKHTCTDVCQAEESMWERSRGSEGILRNHNSMTNRQGGRCELLRAPKPTSHSTLLLTSQASEGTTYWEKND